MSYLTRQMEDNHFERKIEGALQSFRQEVEARLNVLEQPENPPITVTSSPNYLPNSHPEWSHKAYLQTGVLYGDTDDDNRRAYNWEYRLNTDFQTTVSPAQYLVSDGHSTFASLPPSAPIWQKADGSILLGSANEEDDKYDAVAKLPTDFVFPGQRFYVSFEARLDGILGWDVVLGDAEFVLGFWDGYQEKWISGDPFTITAETFGIPGSRTFKYKILASTDTGYQILSTEAVVTNVPDTLDGNNHVRLYFAGAPGFVRFEIFRYDQGANTYRKVADLRNSIDLQYFDVQEVSGVVADGYPAVTTTTPEAVVTSSEMTLTERYTPYTFIIQIPSTYNRTLTPNGNQWFRIGLTKHIANARGISVRRFMISEGYGAWTRAALDMGAKSSPVLTIEFDEGPGLIVGPITNGPTCVDLDTLVNVWQNGGVEQIPMRDVEVGTQVVCGWQALPVKSTKEGVVQQVIEFVTEGDKRLVCSESHRLITSLTDRRGTPAAKLSTGDYVLVDWDGTPRLERIIARTVHFGSFVVKSITLPSPHLYVTNGFISHNTKDVPNPYQPGYDTALIPVP